MELSTESLLAVTAIISAAFGFLIRSPVMKLFCEALEKLRGQEKRDRRRTDRKTDHHPKQPPPAGPLP